MTNMKSNLHPSTEMLEKFVSGDLSVGVNLAISAHVEMCDQCKSAIQEIELSTADQWTNAESSSSAVYQADTASMIDSIIATPQLKEPIEEESEVGSIHMLDRSVKLPKVLAKAASEGLVWKQLGAGISQADVKIDEEAHCSFLYMKPGSQTPVHKHQGTETTLVLDGSMTDELGEYGKSDFIFRTNNDTHQPRTEDGCLCFSVLDSPLTFTKGLARLLNPINRLRFQRAVGKTLS
ncbi:MAG: zinc-binding anti-sigmaE4 factor ChrR [Gammaproteobacteria bacterium]|nr:MAG: zinc-binding anti-sigmaE4 factor ChrR [Gammaproteobacteria bacterium]